MLKLHVVHRGGHRYYVDDLVPGRAEGTGVAGEEPGRWLGSGAVELGLSGEVGPVAFDEVLNGRHPGCGRPLRRGGGPHEVAGYDLTFSAPKSVSVLHLLAPGELATAAGTAHQAAVTEAAEYLGRAGVGVRRVHGGRVDFLPSTGAVAGQFLHRTSRALDPHLHTHLVVANVAQGVDGTWSAVDSRRLFGHLGAAQAVYHARLRLELSERAGVSWKVPSNGLGDVVGVDRRLCRLFSQRTAAMDEFRYGRGRGSVSGPGSDRAFHATRPGKDRTVTVDALLAEWRRRAVGFGFDLGELIQVVGQRGPDRDQPVIDQGRVSEHLQRLAERRVSLRRHDLVAVLAASSPGGAPARLVESMAAALVTESGPVRSSRAVAEVARVTGQGWSDLLGRAGHRQDRPLDTRAPATGRTMGRVPAVLVRPPSSGGLSHVPVPLGRPRERSGPSPLER